ncbi:MAG TPA: lipid-A-disaccharide synthase [Rickettsiales bacterium]|nr:lipid-A-disaccharide synthase [Rickettsiales bacterium]
MSDEKKIFITAGEASGDLLGGKIINSLKSVAGDINIKFFGVGGEKMESEGLKSIFPMKELSIMGFFEILPRIFKLLKRINKTVKEILVQKPDIIITIDSPGFSFRVMKKLRSKNKNFFDNVKKVHLIAPSIWAYNEKRAKKMAKLYNLLLCILPFEPQYFEKYGLKAEFIGHPIFDNTEKYKSKYTRSDLLKNYNITLDDIVIILTPGSRETEIERIFPIMIETIEILKKEYDDKYKDIQIFTFVNSYTRDLVEFMSHEYEFNNRIITDETEKQKITSSANIVLAKSGTNTFEFNIFNVPLVVVYTFNWLTNKIAKKMIKIRYANIVNIMANKEIIPEFVLDNAKPELIADKLNKILNDKHLAKQQIQETIQVINKLGYNSDNKASINGANKILELIK